MVLATNFSFHTIKTVGNARTEQVAQERTGCISVRVTSTCVERDVTGGHCGLPLAAEHNTTTS